MTVDFAIKFISIANYLIEGEWTYRMYSVNVNVRPLQECQHQFALCESCFWCATIFHNSIIEQEYVAEDDNNNTFQICPMCKDKSVSMMHLAKDERYTVSIGEKRGLEMKFSKT